MSTVLVTGSSGFIGRNLVKRLLKDSIKVIGIDIEDNLFADSIDGDLSKNFTFLKGDLRDGNFMERISGDPIDSIVHLAAFTRVVESVAKPKEYFENNVVVTQRLMDMAVQKNIGKFILASTNAVAGDVGFNTITDRNVLYPQSPYGATKAASEMMLSSYRSSFGLSTVRLRFTNIYGTDMATKDSFIARMCKAALGDKRIAVYGDGHQVRDYIYLGDVLNVIRAALFKDCPEVVVVGSGSSISVNDLVKKVEQATEIKFEIDYQEAKKGEMKAVIVDNHSIEFASLDQITSLEVGLQKTWDWFKNYYSF